MTIKNDILHRYLFDGMHVRGELVQVKNAFQTMVANHNYPQGVKNLLGEVMAATSLLTATIKFEGEITVQLQGDGPIGYLAVNGNHQQQMRGLAKLKHTTEATTLKDLIGKGNMVITIQPSQGDPYQGIVALEHDTFAECIAHYFEVSEQIPTKIWLFSDEENEQVAGSLIQLLPDGEDKTKQQDDFDHLCQLTDTIKQEEIFSLDAEELLYRLYHQEEVRLFDPQAISFKCGCSAEKCLTAIAQIDASELKNIIAEQGKVSMTCDACQTTYAFGEVELASFLSDTSH